MKLSVFAARGPANLCGEFFVCFLLGFSSLLSSLSLSLLQYIKRFRSACSHIVWSGGWLQRSQLRLAGPATCAPSAELAFSKSPLVSSLRSPSIWAGFNRTSSITFVASAYFLADSYLCYINSTWNVSNLQSLEDHWPAGCCTSGSSRNSSF